jgi:hypothetical protein
MIDPYTLLGSLRYSTTIFDLDYKEILLGEHLRKPLISLIYPSTSFIAFIPRWTSPRIIRQSLQTPIDAAFINIRADKTLSEMLSSTSLNCTRTSETP